MDFDCFMVLQAEEDQKGFGLLACGLTSDYLV
jgi:hypothetical protein